MMENKEPKPKKSFVGEVVSDKMDKTVVVRVSRSYVHPMYKKVVRTDKTYKVHDEREEAKVGDTVEIFEGRHMSKTKYMYLGRVLETSVAR